MGTGQQRGLRHAFRHEEGGVLVGLLRAKAHPEVLECLG